MDAIEKYVTELNISRFLTLLGEEEDGAKFSLWTKLLLAEEDRFGKAVERLAMAERCRDVCVDQIGNHRARLAELEPEHPLFAIASRQLDNMVEIQAVVENRIANLKTALDGTSGRAL